MWFVVVLDVITGTFLVLVGLLLALDPPNPPPANRGLGVVIVVLAGLFFLLVAARSAIGGVRIRNRTVEVHNIFRTRRFPVDVVDRFEATPDMLGNGMAGGVRLVDGAVVRATLLGGANGVFGDRALDGRLAGLNADLADART